MTNNSKIVFPAEWDDRVKSILIAFPQENMDWNYMLDEIRNCYIKLIKAITDIACLNVTILASDIKETSRILTDNDVDMSRISLCSCENNDSWTRDYGPITVEIEGAPVLLDFCFNGWGMKFAANHDNLVNSVLESRNLWKFPVINNRDFIIEGGALESDGNGTVMTNIGILAPNRNDKMTKSEVEETLKKRLGCKQILWVHHGNLFGDDTDGHIDTKARFVDPSTIIYVKSYNPEDKIQFEELQLMEKELQSFSNRNELPYRLIPLLLPSPQYDKEGNRLPATYANFLITPRAILFPTYRNEREDNQAALILSQAFPGKIIKGVDCVPLIQQHGSLHCATMQIFDKINNDENS